jgi:hypothetical protein
MGVTLVETQILSKSTANKQIRNTVPTETAAVATAKTGF